MNHRIIGLFLWAVTFITTPAAAATPNHCEFIIVEIQHAVEIGTLNQREADEIISRCVKELWGED